MSDAADEFEFNARQLLNKGKTHSLRKQMREFVSENEPPADFKEPRTAVSGEKSISDVVTEDREERL